MKADPWPLIIFLGLVTISSYIGAYMMLKSPVQTAQGEGLVLIHGLKPDQRERSPTLVTATLTGSDSQLPRAQIELFYAEEKKAVSFHRLPMIRVGDSNRFVQLLPGQPKGKKSYYYLVAIGPEGQTLRLPDNPALLLVRWVGDSSRWLLYSHIIFMLGSFLVFMHAFYYSLVHLLTRRLHPRLYAVARWGTALFFVAGFPLGMAVAYQAFGVAWTGLPVGTDITDNKTLIVFLFWLAALILHKGNPLALKRDKTFVLGPRPFSALILVGAILTLVVFLIPHSV